MLKAIHKFLFGPTERQELEAALKRNQDQVKYWTTVIKEVSPVYPWYREELRYHQKQVEIIQRKLERL